MKKLIFSIIIYFLIAAIVYPQSPIQTTEIKNIQAAQFITPSPTVVSYPQAQQFSEPAKLITQNLMKNWSVFLKGSKLVRFQAAVGQKDTYYFQLFVAYTGIFFAISQHFKETGLVTINTLVKVLTLKDLELTSQMIHGRTVIDLPPSLIDKNFAILVVDPNASIEPSPDFIRVDICNTSFLSKFKHYIAGSILLSFRFDSKGDRRYLQVLYETPLASKFIGVAYLPKNLEECDIVTFNQFGKISANLLEDIYPQLRDNSPK